MEYENLTGLYYTVAWGAGCGLAHGLIGRAVPDNEVLGAALWWVVRGLGIVGVVMSLGALYFALMFLKLDIEWPPYFSIPTMLLFFGVIVKFQIFCIKMAGYYWGMKTTEEEENPGNI